MTLTEKYNELKTLILNCPTPADSVQLEFFEQARSELCSVFSELISEIEEAETLNRNRQILDLPLLEDVSVQDLTDDYDEFCLSVYKKVLTERIVL